MSIILIEELLKWLDNRLKEINESRYKIYDAICKIYNEKYILEKGQYLMPNWFLARMMSGNKWHYITNRKKGKYYYYDDELDKYQHMIDRIGIEYIMGNDAPRKGEEGNYLQFKFTEGKHKQLVLKDTEFKPLLMMYYNMTDEYNFIEKKLKETIEIKNEIIKTNEKCGQDKI